VDVVLVGFIAGYIFTGWRTGFLRRLLGLGFMALSFVASVYLRYPIGAIASTFFKDIPPEYANLVGSAIAFPVVLGALHVVSHAMMGRLAMQGMSKELDKALGAVFGGIEAVLIVSAVVVLADTYFGTSSVLPRAGGPESIRSLVAALNGSTTVHLMRDTTIPLVLAILGPFLPTDVKTLLPSGLPAGFPIPTLKP
jgi:uncharacterized membrane protein required for colicin V production